MAVCGAVAGTFSDMLSAQGNVALVAQDETRRELSYVEVVLIQRDPVISSWPLSEAIYANLGDVVVVDVADVGGDGIQAVWKKRPINQPYGE